MEFIFTIFSIIASFLTDKLYITSLINNLFFFDIDKKLYLLKKIKILFHQIISLRDQAKLNIKLY